MMLSELSMLLAEVPEGSSSEKYREAILVRNVLSKPTGSTRKETLRRLSQLYAIDEGVAIFGLLRKLQAIDVGSLPLLAIQVAWARDPLLRAMSQPILDSLEGDRVETVSFAQALDASFPSRYSELSQNTFARNAASSWTQSGHLFGHTKKTRKKIKPTNMAVTMALFLGDIAGYHGTAVFSNPWCRLLDLAPAQSRSMGQEAHRAGLVNLRTVGNVVELNFPLLTAFQGQPT